MTVLLSLVSRFDQRSDTQLYGQSSDDILARARAAVGAPEPEKEVHATPFDEETLGAIQRTMDILSKRTMDGVGSVTAAEVRGFEEDARIIQEEMARHQAGAQTIAAPNREAPQEAIQEAIMLEAPQKVMDLNRNDEEGAAYDGHGGMGLASGTRNTYIIEGMDEMTPLEYQKALQKSVSDRQAGRLTNRNGVVGNRAAHAYLDQLGYGGASKSLSVGKDKE